MKQTVQDDVDHYKITRGHPGIFDQGKSDENKERCCLPPTNVAALCRSRTPPRGPASPNGPVPHPYEEEEHTRNGIQNSSLSQTTHTMEDREARRSISPPHHPRNFRGPRTPSPEHN